MNQRISISQAGFENVGSTAKLFDQYRQFYGQPSDLAGATQFISDRLRLADSVIFVATINDAAEAKYAGLTQLYPSFSSISMRRSWILSDLFVEPTYRKLGIARLLMERARRFGMESGSVELTLMTAKDNFAAQSLYRALGWQMDEAFLTFTLDL